MSTGGHINRRVIVTSGIAFIGFAVVSPQSARAGLLKNLVHSVGKVTTTIVHGASSVVHEVKTLAHDAANVATQVEQKVLPLVKTGIGLIGDAVQEAEGIGSAALSVLAGMEGAAGTIASQVSQLALQGPSQALMLVNTSMRLSSSA